MLRTVLTSARVNPVYATRYASCTARDANREIIELLRKSARSDGNKYKIVAFARAIKTIEGLDYPISSLKSTDAKRTAEKAKIIKGVGYGIAQRIAAHLHKDEAESSSNGESSSSAQESPNLDIEARQKAIASLQIVPGIGKKLATELVDEGCLSLDQLRVTHYKDLLPPSARVGATFIDDILQDVTDQHVERVTALIRDTVDPKFEVHVVGPHRRGLPSSPSLSLLCLHPSFDPPIEPPREPPLDRGEKGKRRGRHPQAFSTTYTSDVHVRTSLMFRRLLSPLTEEGIIAGVLGSGVEKSTAVVRIPRVESYGKWESKEERLMGVESRQGVFRKVEFHLAPHKSKFPALAALTGDAEFLRDLLTRARLQLMHLNEYGLWRWVWSSDQVKAPGETANRLRDPEDDLEGKWQGVEVGSERELLSVLGMEWVEPEKRNFGFIVGKAAGVKKGRGRPRKGV